MRVQVNRLVFCASIGLTLCEVQESGAVVCVIMVKSDFKLVITSNFNLILELSSLYCGVGAVGLCNNGPERL